MKKLLIVCDYKREFMLNCLNNDLKVSGLYDLYGQIEGVDISQYACMIVCGASSAALLGFTDSIKKLRTQSLRYKGVPLYVTNSPAMLKYDRLALVTMGKDIHKAFASIYGVGKVDYNFTQTETCTSEEQIRSLHRLAKHTGRLSVDSETKACDPKDENDKPSALDRERCLITCISLSAQPGHSLVAPIDHFERKGDQAMWYALNDLFSDPTIDKVLQNAKFDLFIFRRYGWLFRGIIHDTILMHHQLFNYKDHGLKDMVREYFPSIADYEMALEKYNKNFGAIPWHDLAPYAGIDADVTLRFSYIFEDMMLTRDVKEYISYRNLMSAGIKPLINSEFNGCRIDRDMLSAAIVEATELVDILITKMRAFPEVVKWEQVTRKAEIQKAIDKCRAKIASATKPHLLKRYQEELSKVMSGGIPPTVINFNSTLNLRELLYDKGMGFEFEIPTDYEVRENKRSTNEQPTDKFVLAGIPDESGFIDMLLVYRGVVKTLSTYLSSILEKTDANGYVHGEFNLAGTKTFRLSSSKPNLQNVISRSKYDEVMKVVACVKRAFIPDPDEVLLVVDYSQAELRGIAHYSGDETMISAYNNDKDLHTLGACATLHITEEEFHQKDKAEQKSLRQRAKARNFGLIYGMSAEGFRTYAKNQYGVELTLEEAQQERLAFFKMYPKLLSYHDDMRAFADLHGYVPTLFGSRCYLPDLLDRMRSQHSKYYATAMRNAINSPIQGTAGQLTLFAIALLHLRLDPRVKIINTVHDSIIFSVPKYLLRASVAIIEDTMVNPPLEKFFGVNLKVKLAVDFEASLVSWKDVVPLNEFLDNNPAI